MQSFKIKVSADQLNVIYGFVSAAATLPVKDFQHKLLVSIMIGLHKKMMHKWTYPSNMNKITFTAPEAIAFHLMFSNEDFFDPFQFATMNPILTEIHKLYL